MARGRSNKSAASMPVPLVHASAFVIPDICTTFRELGVSAAVAADRTWYPLHTIPDVTEPEKVHGAIEARYRYNDRTGGRAERRRETIVGTHAGFHDVFVPVGPADDVWGVLVSGPFAVSRPVTADVLERWRRLAGARGRLSSGAFARYLSLTLSTLTLDRSQVDDFTRLLERFSELLAGRATSADMAVEIATLRERLLRARFAERMWAMARAIVDERTMGEWLTRATAGAFADMRIARLPQHAAVGLLLDARREMDAVEGVLRRDAFHHACIALAVEAGGVVAGRVGDHGLVLLLDDPRSGVHPRRRLVELTRRAEGLARRHGLSIHWGVAIGSDGRSLPARYESALSAAEQALSQGVPLLESSAAIVREVGVLSALRRQLALVARERPTLLAARFDRYVEAACRECGYRAEPVRVHFEAGFEQIVNALSDVGALDEKTRAELPATVGRDAEEARTLEELAAVFRQAVADLGLAASKPTVARQQRSIRRATSFIHDHLAEPLTLAMVARAAGFAPAYFSTLFAKSERTTFRNYVTRLRVERSKQMLASTNLSVERVSQLVGFASRVHFHRAFHRRMKMTPTEYRDRKR